MESNPITIAEVQRNIGELTAEMAFLQSEIYRNEAIGHLIVAGEFPFDQPELPYEA